MQEPLYADEFERRDSSERQGGEESDGGHVIHLMENWPPAKLRRGEDALESTECFVRIPQGVLSLSRRRSPLKHLLIDMAWVQSKSYPTPLNTCIIQQLADYAQLLRHYEELYEKLFAMMN